MRLIRTIIILLVLVFGGYYLLDMYNVTPKEAVKDISEKLKSKTSTLQTKIVPDREQSNINLDGKLFQWIGENTDELTKSLGEPIRKDLSAYGYEWWVYTDQTKTHIQFGVLDHKITTVYATGKDLSTEPIHVGQTYQDVNKQFSFKNEVTFYQGVSSYTFKLDDKEMEMRPLVKLADNVFLQCYFDTVTSKLSAIRVLTGDVLLKQRPYAIEYRGSLPEEPNLTDEEWNKVEKGMEQQIFSITNVIRNQHDKSKLKWGDSVSEVAFLHSKDMAVNKYFSHYRLNGDGLKERLAAKEVYYLAAGENIAARYPDAPAAMQGWLNSKGHREALLEKDYTHLGVGVYHFYYTQNFLQKPMGW
ncbi:CAP domain-containing protein [Virgibacillus necropolis]|uniref:CAP domain-containing protein n=1 Tax=Virgibacillus necropolis TaxID=163877 RepID=UPI00384E0DA5